MLLRAVQPPSISLAGRQEERRADFKAKAELTKYQHKVEKRHKVVKKQLARHTR